MNDTIPDTRVEGKILLEGDDIYAPEVDLAALRQKVGMVFQNQTHFPNLYLIMLLLGQGS